MNKTVILCVLSSAFLSGCSDTSISGEKYLGRDVRETDLPYEEAYNSSKVTLAYVKGGYNYDVMAEDTGLKGSHAYVNVAFNGNSSSETPIIDSISAQWSGGTTEDSVRRYFKALNDYGLAERGDLKLDVEGRCTPPEYLNEKDSATYVKDNGVCLYAYVTWVMPQWREEGGNVGFVNLYKFINKQ